MGTFIKSIKNLIDRLIQAYVAEKVFLVISVFILCLFCTGVIFYITVERLSVIDAMYSCVMLITSVGSSEFTPKTNAGKIFTILFTLLGTGLFLGLITGLAQAVIIKEYSKEKGGS